MNKKSPLAGKTVKIKKEANEIGGGTFHVEDFWKTVSGKSWMVSTGNPAALNYAMRTGFSGIKIPTDDNVLYGKIDGLGFLVHECEIEKED